MIKKLLIALFLMLPALAQAQTTDLQKVRISSFEGGANSKDFFDKIELNQGQTVQNLEINNKGQAITRKGQSLFNTDVGVTPFLGLGAYYADSTNDYIVTASGTSVVRSVTSAGGGWQQISTSSMGSSHDTQFIQAKNLLFAYNGSVTNWWNGSTWNVGGTYPGTVSPPTVTTATYLNNYLFMAGNSASPNLVYVSDNLQPQSFSSALNALNVNNGDGQSIKRIEKYRAGDIIVYKDRSIWDIDITGVDSTCSPQPVCQWSIKPISNDLGTPAPRSVVSLGNDQWFLSSQPFAVRSVISSQFDKTFVQMNSKPIQDIFDGTGTTILNTTHVDVSAAVLFNNKYILAIPTGSSAVNNFVVVYDFLTNSWWTLTGWYPKDWIVYRNELYYTDANDGRVVKCFSGTTGDFGSTAAITTPATAIHTLYYSRGIDGGYPENYKNLDSVSIEFYPSGNYSATIYINLDNGGWQSVGTVNLAGNALTLPFSLPGTLTAGGLAIKTIPLQSYGTFKRAQIGVELNGVSQTMTLQGATLYFTIKPWQRDR